MTETLPPHRGPGRPLSFDRDAVLVSAMDLLWDGGYEATPVGELIDAMGLSRSSFYAAFGSKRGVFLAAVRLYSDRCITLLREIAARDESCRERLREMVHSLAMVDGDRGCLMANSISEQGRQDPEMRNIAARHNETVERIVSEVLPAAPAGDRAAHARALISGAYGATLLRIAGTDPDAILQMLDAMVDRTV